MNKFTTSLLSGLVVQAVSGYASATTINEIEDNSTLSQAQYLTADGTSGISIYGVIGRLDGSSTSDRDFFEFYAQKGDVINLDIDQGYNAGQGSVDTVIAVFDESGNKLRENDDASLDPGSVYTFDSRIDAFVAPETGHYVVGVSNFPHFFMDGGDTYYSTMTRNGGDYILNITGLTPEGPSITYINIEVKPGSNGDGAPINPKSKGKIPVALLSSQEFKPMQVDTTTLRFGKTGKENSLSKCNKSGEDLNNDGFLDLVCHFENQKTQFDYNSVEGVVTGQARIDGKTINFEGSAPLKVVPQDNK